MSDQQINSGEPAGSSEGPPTKRPCTIDTPPIAHTPDNGSDFYNTPLAAGTPVIGNTTAATGKSTIEFSESSKPSPMIPGLGLVNAPHDQLSSSKTTEAPALKTDKSQPQGTNSDQEGNRMPMEVEQNSTEVEQNSSEVEIKQESNKDRFPHEANDAGSDAMEVDQKPEKNEPQTIDEISAAQTNETNDQTQEEHEEQPEWETDSSPYESSSDSSSSSDSEDSDDEEYSTLTPEEQARILMLAEAGSDEEGDTKGKSGGYIRSTNEIMEEVLPIPDVKITPEMKIVYLGKVQAAIDNAALIEANTSGDYQVLESGSLLCSADRQVLGVVSEVLGRVEHPLYSVMYSTAEEAQERGMVKGAAVYYVEAHSTFVFTQPLKGMKGSDASNFHDEEVAEDEIEFSDDEAEADYKRKVKQKRQERNQARDGGSAKSKRGPPGPSKLSQTELNYDDYGGEDGYTPLTRPKNLHEMMGVGEAPVEGGDRGSGSGAGLRGGRGRGRGSDRGRGRGRGGGGRDQDHRSQSSSSQYGSPAPSQPQSQPVGYGQPAHHQQQPIFGMPQPFAAYQQYPQQQPQLGQGVAPVQFPFQFPFQQPFSQPTTFPSIPPGAHINPLFLAALQQQQQQQGLQPQLQPQQNPTMNFDQVKAQLDLLRNLNNQNQPPPPPPSS